MACAKCLGRSWLLAGLGGRIERVAMDSNGQRARDLLALPDEDLASALGCRRPAEPVRRAAAMAAEWVASPPEDVWAACGHDPDFPQALRDLGAAAPRALLGRGERSRLPALAQGPVVAIVGARRATAYGREVASALARMVAGSGVVVISGLAYGVDAAAHGGALAAEGMTVAVLGSGPDVAYPDGERRLYRRVAATGLVLSEMPPGFRPFRWSFPARNRVIAALARLTVVVEARKRSGSLITAGMAADLGRDVGAVPGPVTSALSRGANDLLADGAALIRSASDVLDLLGGLGQQARDGELPRPVLEPPLAAALEAVEGGARTPDEVAFAAGLSAPEAWRALARLELGGHVCVDASGRYARRASEREAL